MESVSRTLAVRCKMTGLGQVFDEIVFEERKIYSF